MGKHLKRRLHRLRGGDGKGIPEGKPPVLWPDMGDIEPYWESFQAFARSEMPGDDIEFTFRLDGRSGEYTFVAFQSRQPDENYGGTSESETHRLTYDPTEDEMEMTQKMINGDTGWVMEDAFGDPLDASPQS